MPPKVILKENRSKAIAIYSKENSHYNDYNNRNYGYGGKCICVATCDSCNGHLCWRNYYESCHCGKCKMLFVCNTCVSRGKRILCFS